MQAPQIHPNHDSFPNEALQAPDPAGDPTAPLSSRPADLRNRHNRIQGYFTCLGGTPLNRGVCGTSLQVVAGPRLGRG